MKQTIEQLCGIGLTCLLIRHLKSTYACQYARTLSDEEERLYLMSIAMFQNHSLDVLRRYYNDDNFEKEKNQNLKEAKRKRDEILLQKSTSSSSSSKEKRRRRK